VTRMKTDSARGQIILVVAFGLVVLVTIAALAIDLGFSWMLRRHEQNAADPAALAAARFISDPDPVTGIQTFDGVQGWDAACQYVRQNGFFSAANTACTPEADGTAMFVNYPPDATAPDFVGQPGMVQVILSAQHDSFFGRIFGQTRATVTSQAVAARQRGETNTHSLISLKPDGCATAKIHGSGNVKIYPAPGYTGPGGYVQINSDCGSNTADDNCTTSSQGALDVAGTAHLSAPQVDVHGGCKGNAAEPTCPVPAGLCNTSTGPLNEAASQLSDPLGGLVFPPWDTSAPGARCGASGPTTTSLGSEGCGQGGGRIPWSASPASACPGLPAGYECIELDPGVYYGGWSIGSKIRVTLKPGIYVIAGGGISIGATGSLDSLAGGAAPAPILIYNTDNPLYADVCPGGSATRCQGSLDLTAGANLKVAGLLADQPCPPVTTSGGCPFGGMVIWYDRAGSQPTNDNSSCAGGAACVEISGGSTLYISGTIYAPRAHVKIDGNSGTNCGSGSETQVAAVQVISWTWDLGGTGDLCMPYDPTKLYKLVAQGLVH
jgi:Putative Flp pilus-assembly TadE/G-like